MKLWYYGHANEQLGPVDDVTLRGKIAAGEVTADSLVWRDGMGDWQPLREVAELQEPAAGIDASAGPGPMAAGHIGGYPPPTNGLAIASMVCGIAGIAMMMCYGIGVFAGIAAVICGHMALKKIREAPYVVAGRGMAQAGLITGYFSIVLTAFAVIFGLVFFLSKR